MSDYKNSILRELGIKGSSFKSSKINEDEFPGIDPNDQDDSMEQQPSTRDRMMSPTAVMPQVLAVAVRGSSTGGLPSGTNMTPSKLGGYEPVSNAKENSVVVNKTPVSDDIQSPAPIAKDVEDCATPGDEHPHQTQTATDEPPQAVTGASVEDEGPMPLKSALPQGIDIDVSEEKSKAPLGAGELAKLKVKENKVSTTHLQKMRYTLQEKAIAGKMNEKESQIFACITEVLQKRGFGLEQRIYGKKSMLETAGVMMEKGLSHEELASAWQDDSSSGEYISVNDRGDAYYHGKLIVPSDNMNANWKGIKAWCNQNGYWPNVWIGNDHGNVDLYTVSGKHLGGLV